MSKIARDPIPMKWFGRDHASVFLYVETRCVDDSGRPNHDHMRTDRTRHPHLMGRKIPRRIDIYAPPTRLRNSETVPNHDDWDCAMDLEAAGLLTNIGTGLQPRWKLTTKGWKTVSRLRQHRASGERIETFNWTPKRKTQTKSTRP